MRRTKLSEQHEKAHLENFDDLDFNVFSGQKWDQLGKSHAKDVIVHWPDGRTTKGIFTYKEDNSCQQKTKSAKHQNNSTQR